MGAFFFSVESAWVQENVSVEALGCPATLHTVVNCAQPPYILWLVHNCRGDMKLMLTSCNQLYWKYLV